MTILKSKLTLLIISIIFFLLSGFLVVLLIIFLSTTSSSTKTTEPTTTYQIQEFNPDLKSPNFGFVELPTKLEHKEDYITYRNDETGHQAFISNFGGECFKCSGSCYCSTESSRRAASATVLTRGLYLLVSALSVSMATNMAKDAFQEDCLDQYSNQCDETHIISELTDCERCQKGDSRKFSLSDELTEDGKEWADDDDILQDRDFECTGKCIPHPLLFDDKEKWTNAIKWFGEEKGNTDAKCEDLVLQKKVLEVFCTSPEQCLKKAKNMFYVRHFLRFCYEASWIEKLKYELCTGCTKEDINCVPIADPSLPPE